MVVEKVLRGTDHLPPGMQNSEARLREHELYISVNPPNNTIIVSAEKNY